MNYLRSLFPNSVPTSIDPSNYLARWQEESLHILAIVGIVAGALATLLTTGLLIGSPDFILVIGFGLLLVVSLAIFLSRRISFTVRSMAFLALMYLLILILFTKTGWSGETLLALIAFSILGTSLLESRQALVVNGIGLATLILCLALASSNIFANMIIITHGSLLLDTVVVILVAALANFGILSIKSSYLKKNQKLISALAESDELQARYEAQSADLQHRLAQLRAGSEISQSLASILDPGLLIQQVAERLKSAFTLYYVGVFLVDPTREYAILRYGTGDEGKKMAANRHRLAVGGYSMIGWATQTRKARIALDVGEEAVHFDNPDLPATRSELALPIKSSTDILGALSIQSDRPNAFDENDVLLLQSVADSLAVALENANSFNRTQKALEDIRILNKAFVQQAWGDEIDQVGELKFNYENPQVTSSPETTSQVKIPLVLRDEVIGYFNLEIEGTEIQPEQNEFLQTISAQTTSALENARLIEETQRAAAQEQKLNELSTQFSRAFTIEEILKTAVEEFGNLPSVFEASISLIPPEDFSIKKKRTVGTEVKS